MGEGKESRKSGGIGVQRHWLGLFSVVLSNYFFTRGIEVHHHRMRVSVHKPNPTEIIAVGFVTSPPRAYWAASSRWATSRFIAPTATRTWTC